MRKSVWFLLVVGCGVLIGLARPGQAVPIYVPDDYTTVQEAIDAATTGAEIVLRPNVYQENILFNGKDLTLRSTDALDPAIVATTILEPSIVKPIVRFSGDETTACLVSGLTFRNGYVSQVGSYDGYGGAINGGNTTAITGSGAKATLANCVFTSNTADDSSYGSGGAIYGFDGAIRDCVFKWNDGGREGGAIDFSNSVITGCLFEGNVARDGGALHSCKSAIVGNVFVRNSAWRGYGGAIMSCSTAIFNNVVYENHASMRGGGISNSFNVKNNILWGNTAVYGSLVDDQIYQVSFPENNCIQNLDHTNWGNITGDPLFDNPGADDFHLTSGSSCIDAGGDFSALGMTPFDIDGDSRGIDAVDDPRGDGSNVDIGIDEYVAVTVNTLRDYLIGRHRLGSSTLEDAGVETGDGVGASDLIERVNTGP